MGCPHPRRQPRPAHSTLGDQVVAHRPPPVRVVLETNLRIWNSKEPPSASQPGVRGGSVLGKGTPTIALAMEGPGACVLAVPGNPCR